MEYELFQIKAGNETKRRLNGKESVLTTAYWLDSGAGINTGRLKIKMSLTQRTQGHKRPRGPKTKRTQRTQKDTQRKPKGHPEDTKRTKRTKNQNYCLKTIHMRRKINNEADNICCPISISCHTYVIWPFYQCAVQIHSTPVKNIFFLFLSFMQICRLDIFAVLKHLHFPNIPIGV